MGNATLRLANNTKEQCAEGAYIQYEPTVDDGLIRAIAEVQHWRCANGMIYASEQQIIDENQWAELRHQIDRKCVEVCGCHISGLHNPPTEGELKKRWVGTRKGHYVAHRDKQPPGDRKECPLWEAPNPQGTIYAYSGMLARFAKRFIKVGYTSKNVVAYLEGYREEFDPKLLCHVAGGKQTEQKYHCKTIPSIHRAPFRKEWYFPDDWLVEWLRRTFDVYSPQFDSLTKEVRSYHPERFIQSTP